MRSMLPDRDVLVRTLRVPTAHGSVPALLLSPRTAQGNATGVLWLHGGGYAVGMKEMVHMSRAVGLVKHFGAVNVAFQMPLYPMLDDRDTETSRDNHGRVWNTRRNHLAWRLYLRGTDRAQLSPYAAPARLTDFTGLPPAYSFVGDGEPFYAETVRYFDRLRAAGVPAKLDVYHIDLHAFDMMRPHDAQSIAAAEAFERQFADAQSRYFAPQKDNV